MPKLIEKYTAVLDLHNELIGCEGYQFCGEGKDENA